MLATPSDMGATSCSSTNLAGGAKLRQYQIESLEFLTRSGRAILADEMGLGKTVVALLASQRLFPKGRVLIVAPKIALLTWQREIRKWLGEEAVVLAGQPSRRAALLQEFLEGKRGRFLITNYDLLKRDPIPRNWHLIIADEAHVLRNRRGGFNELKRFYSQGFFALTGTPVVKAEYDLWPLLHLCNPKAFPSFWAFIYQHFHVIKDQFGTHIETLKNREAFQALLRQYLIRHTKKEVLHELPPKIRQVLPVEMTGKQKRIYNQLAEEMLAELGPDAVIATPTEASKILRLRQVLVSPALVGGPDESGALDALVDLAKEQFAVGKNLVVFTPFRQALPIIERRLKPHCDVIVQISGGLSVAELRMRIERFQRPDKRKKVAICTIKSSFSFDLTAASTAVFVGYEWTPTENYQAEDRLHRTGQTEPVNIFYTMHYGTIDEHVMEVLDRKQERAAVLRVRDLKGKPTAN